MYVYYNIMSMSKSNSVVTNSSERLVGCVKWFNNKAGYGFVTVTGDCSQKGNDIFVHHSGIDVSNQQYKYLVQGEYVEFSIGPTQKGDHAIQATNISGISGGKLMCETRNELKQSRNTYKSSSEETTQKSTKPSSEQGWSLQSKDKAEPSARGGRGAGRGRGAGAGRGRGPVKE
jgi:cold shock CspA family protein